MGLFTTSQKELEEIRGVTDESLPKLNNEQLIMLALARIYDGGRVAEDPPLMEELYRRGRGK